MGELQGKVALITGAGRGFGLAIAELFAAEGADLALNFRASRDGCERVAAAARAAGQRAVAVQADLADGAAVDTMVQQVLDELGRVDILVNNAGIMNRTAFVETSEADWRTELETNIVGTLRVTRSIVPGMIDQRSGKIINLSSPVAVTGRENGSIYAGTKAFVLAWTKSLARELGRHNINVNAIAPGSIPTDMNAVIYPTEEARQKKAAELPLRRLGIPRDCAECALFLASERSAFLTGQLLGPHGGVVMP
jgi:3-oxoacyl-[acyl-carrier protein] reductase